MLASGQVRDVILHVNEEADVVRHRRDCADARGLERRAVVSPRISPRVGERRVTGRFDAPVDEGGGWCG